MNSTPRLLGSFFSVTCSVLVTVVIGANSAAQEAISGAAAIRMPSDPALSPDGRKLAFAWRGDVWLSATQGGQVTRLTADPGNDSQPHFSPDGTQIAFVSNRTGSDQIFLMPTAGGAPKQVTFHSEGYQLHDWFPDGLHLLASGNRDHFWRGTERLLKIRTDRRANEIVLADATAADASLDSTGKRVLFVREGERWWRKGYRGERAAQVWMLELENGRFTELLHEGIDCRWPIWHRNGRSFFYTKGGLNGFGLWQYQFADRKSPEARQAELVRFDDDSIVFPTIARNSGMIVFRHLFDFYRFQPGKDTAPIKIEMSYAGDPVINPDSLRRTLTEANEIAFRPDGLEMVFTAGGDLWAMDTILKEPTRLTSTGAFESSPILSSDGKTIYAIAKRDGQIDIWKIEKLQDQNYWWQPSDYRWTQITNDPMVESDLRLSPKGDSLYYVRGLGDLVRHPLGEGDDVQILSQSFSAPQYDISPCGGWVAYAAEDDDFNSDVWIRATDGGSPARNISQHPDNDLSPRFSPDGKVLAFTSRRIDTETDIFYLYLQNEASEETSRDRRFSDAIKKMKEAEKKGGSDASAKEKDKKNTEGVSTSAAPSEPAQTSDEKTDDTLASEQKEKDVADITRIDFEKITERLRQLSIGNSTESNLFWSPEGKKLAFNARIDGEEGVYTITFPDELNPKKLLGKRITQPYWSEEAKGILGIVDNIPSLVEPSGSIKQFSFSAPQELSRSERLQDAFEVAWTVMRDQWYDPRHAGRNWEEIRRKYSEIARNSADERGLAEVIQLMLGELNGSHNGFTPTSERSSNDSSAWNDQTAHLGLRFDVTHQGPGLKVHDVIPGSPTDRVETKALAGDILISIDGRAVDPNLDLTEILNGRLDRDITLVIQRTEDGKPDKAELRFSIRPISYASARSLLYEVWLEHNRSIVDRVSDGKFGYLHIRGMDMSSFYEFERQLYRVGYGKDGLVIDVRDNGGGSTTDLLLTALTQPRHAITVPRGGGPGYPQSRMVYAVWQKPIVVLCNQNSYSNAEIFSHAIKTLGRGQLVGVQTAGGVISTGAVRITDVGVMRLPFRGWFLPDTGLDMELNGALPQHILWPMPGELPAGTDRQLEKAIEVLAEEIATKAKPIPNLIYAHEEQPAD